MCLQISRRGIDCGPHQAAIKISLVTAVALIVIASVLAAGCFTPGLNYHLSAYMAAGCFVFSLLPLAVSYSLCTHVPNVSFRVPKENTHSV